MIVTRMNIKTKPFNIVNETLSRKMYLFEYVVVVFVSVVVVAVSGALLAFNLIYRNREPCVFVE